jgi:hypothetical protein
MDKDIQRFIATPYVELCYQRFALSYQEMNYGLAYLAFVEAMQEQPECAYRYFYIKASAQLIATLRQTNNVGTIAGWLDRLLPDNPEMNQIYYDDPALALRFSEMREENIAKGLPSVILVTQGKSASISVSGIFNSGFGLPSYGYSLVDSQVIPSWVRDYARGGSCYTTHLDPSERNVRLIKEAGIQKIIVHVRDPRQSIISMIHHNGKYPDQAPTIANSGFSTFDVGHQLQMLFGTYVDYIKWLTNWVKAADVLPIYFSDFKDFVEDRDKFIEGYLDYYGAPRKYFDHANAVTQHAGTDFHLRKGATDEWREVMPENYQKHFSFMLPQLVKERFGWAD